MLLICLKGERLISEPKWKGKIKTNNHVLNISSLSWLQYYVQKIIKQTRFTWRQQHLQGQTWLVMDNFKENCMIFDFMLKNDFDSSMQLEYILVHEVEARNFWENESKKFKDSVCLLCQCRLRESKKHWSPTQELLMTQVKLLTRPYGNKERTEVCLKLLTIPVVKIACSWEFWLITIKL